MQQQNIFDFIKSQQPVISTFDDVFTFIASATAWPEDDAIMTEIKFTRDFASKQGESDDVSDVEPALTEAMPEDKVDFKSVCSMKLIKKGKGASVFFVGKKALELAYKKDNTITVEISNVRFPTVANWVSNIQGKKETVLFDLSDVTDWDMFADYLKHLKQIIFRELTPASIGCCNDYLTCSNAAACIKPHWLSSVKCHYRDNLEHGRIFYGVHKTIKA